MVSLKEVSVTLFLVKSAGYTKGMEPRIYRPILSFGHYKPSFNMLKDLLKEKGDIVHTHAYRNFQTDIRALLSYLRDLHACIIFK